MKTLNIYITRNLLAILIASIIVLTVGMLGGNLLQLMGLISRGVPVSTAMKALLYMMPMMFSFTIPMGILVSVLLLFGKMSADNEITAMKACGISIFQIIAPLIILSFVLAIVCLMLQTYWSPYYWRKGDILTRYIGLNNPEALIQPGQPCNFDDLVVYVKSKDKAGKIKDIQIFAFDKTRENITQDITAASGIVTANKDLGFLYLTLYNYNIINYEEANNKKGEDRLYGKEFILSINVIKQINDEPLQNRIRFMTFTDLMGKISLYKKLGFPTTEMETQLNLMFAMGVAPIAFLLIGFPLALRTSRRETSIGLFISVVLAGFFFFFMIICNTLNEKPELYPQYLLWLPNIVYQLGGLYILYKVTKR